jgi:trans-2-enoyl-CoA reductase
MTTARCIGFAAFGNPPEVAQVQSFPVAEPGPGQLRLRLRFAPINPADLNVFEGTYGRKPDLPAVAGNEAAGVVDAVGPDVEGFAVGDKALPLLPGGLWSQSVIVPAHQVVKLQQGIDDQQAAMLRVNPLTAWLLLREFVDLRPGDWVVQNAGNSGVGLAVVQLAAQLGVRTLNFVRRPEAAEICRQHGAECIVVEDGTGNAADAALQMLGSERPKLALNAVGGESALRLAGLLADRGLHVTYGAMSKQKLSIPNRFLIFKELTFTGFWVTRWLETASREEIRKTYSELALLMEKGFLRLPVEKVYPLDEIANGLRHAQENARSGKVLLCL